LYQRLPYGLRTPRYQLEYWLCKDYFAGLETWCTGHEPLLENPEQKELSEAQKEKKKEQMLLLQEAQVFSTTEPQHSSPRYVEHDKHLAANHVFLEFHA
jgi:hypothetical protein